MPNFSKLPRNLIEQIAKNPRSIKFIENLQSQAFDLLPATIQEILLVVQQAQVTADDAKSMAIQAMNQKPDDALGLVGVPFYPNDQMIGLVSVFDAPIDALGLVEVSL